MSTRQDTIEDRLANVEEKLSSLQDQLDILPDVVAARIQAQVNKTEIQDWSTNSFISARENRSEEKFPASRICSKFAANQKCSSYLFMAQFSASVKFWQDTIVNYCSKLGKNLFYGEFDLKFRHRISGTYFNNLDFP